MEIKNVDEWLEDSDMAESTKEILRQYLVGRTAVLVTHSSKDLDMCDKILRLECKDRSIFTPIIFQEKTDM